MTDDDLPGASQKGANPGASLAGERETLDRDATPHPGPFSRRGEWPPGKIPALVALWYEGLPTLEIGRRLGVSKNAVIGKVHRLGLMKRASPIHPSKKPKPVVWTLYNIGPGQCRFPTGDPGHEDFHLCGEPVKSGKTYCVSHYALTHRSAGFIGGGFQIPNFLVLVK